MLANHERLRRWLLVVVGAALTSIVVALAVTDLLRQLELDTVDARFELRGDQPPPADLVQVDIDDRSFDAIDAYPLPRRMHARVIDELNRAGAKAIAYDVQFTEPTAQRQDEALMKAVYRARGRIVLGTTEVNERGEPGIFGSLEQLRALGGRAGSMLLVTDRDGIVRRLPYEIDGLKSLAVATAEVAERRRIPPDELGGPTAWIDYRGEPQTIRHVSFSDVLQGRVDEAVFRDKIVLVGVTAPTEQDYESTSIGADKPMSGVEVHANSLWTVLQRTPLEPTGKGLQLALIVLLGMVVPIAAVRRRGRRGVRAFLLALALAIAIGGLYLVAARFAFSTAGLILPVVYPLTALFLSTVGVAQTELTMAVLERDRIRARFSRYVPESIVDDVISKTDDDLCLGGERVLCTVVMCDLRDFTTFAERLPPQRALDTLNVYLSEMSEAIRGHGGTLVDYQSDGIVAAFGAPIEQEDHADRALAAVREMVGPRLEKFNAWVRANRLGPGFRIGIGVDSGVVMSGNMGCSFRLEYTVIGDTANTASRLEEMTKQYPHQVLITETTLEMRVHDKSELPRVGTAEIRGREGVATLFTLDEAGAGATVTQMPAAAQAGQRSPGTTSPVS